MRWYLAPAKINLMLHVVGRREDGYHDLQTIFQFLSEGDRLSYSINQSGVIDRSYDLGIASTDDLTLRAATLLREHVGDSSLGVTIGMDKRIPMGGGLGGGSSDAATTLCVLNELWEAGFSNDQLRQMALTLGADVPVFVGGFAAWAEGIGERLTPISLPQPWYVILTPPVAVSTARIFSHNDLTVHPQMKKIRALQREQIGVFGRNDLEPIVRALEPSVDRLIEWMSQYGPARMSGSGASVFVPLASEQAAQHLLNERPAGTEGFVAQGINTIVR